MQPLIYKQSLITLNNGETAEMLHVQGGPVILVSQLGLASFKNEQAVDDPLGNGRLGYAEIPESITLSLIDGSFVAQIRSGFIQLHDGKAMLVTPFHATLFTSNDDALEGKNKIAQVPLNDIDLV
ncbi:MAG: hypothetical protein CSA49_02200 [Gammaproteobacteria bacterium]|nr:MAG: hypothetical protein CSA49_02200 [Gammaproteobacteria bacterium]